MTEEEHRRALLDENINSHKWDGDSCVRCHLCASDCGPLDGFPGGGWIDRCPYNLSLIDKVAEAWSGCERCPLHAGANGVVVGAGDPASKLLIVGEAPGEQEDTHLNPFIGRSGQFFRKQARLAGVDLGEATLQMLEQPYSDGFDPSGKPLPKLVSRLRVDHGVAYWTNIVGCRPPDNRIPMFDEIAACRPRVDGIVAAIRPAAILIVGGVALTPLTSKTGITRARGKWIDTTWKWKGETWTIPAMPTLHPSGLMRNNNPADIEAFRSDIKAAYDRAYNVG